MHHRLSVTRLTLPASAASLGLLVACGTVACGTVLGCSAGSDASPSTHTLVPMASGGTGNPAIGGGAAADGSGAPGEVLPGMPGEVLPPDPNAGAAGQVGGLDPNVPVDPNAPKEEPPPVVDPTLPDPPVVPNGYRVIGNQILNDQGAPHRFYGVNRPSFEWSVSGEGGDVFAAISGWGANVVRLPLNSTFWNSNSGGYQDTIATQVTAAHAAGLDVILDLHRNSGTDQTADENKFAARSAIGFWTSVAQRFKDDPRVLFELYNEPHDIPWKTWRSGSAEYAGMTEMYDAVRQTGAHNLVLIGGLNWAYDLAGIQGGIPGYNIVYITHIYDFPGKQPANWPSNFGNLAQTLPIMITEFGTATDECGAAFDQQVIDYAAQIGIGWVSWAWYPGDCSFPALVTDWAGTPTVKGTVIRNALMSR